MPGLVQPPEFKHFSINPLHPTFGAEITDLDLTNNDISNETFQELLAAMSKYGFCVIRNTGLDDTSHVDFSRRFGELDDIRPYMVGGRKPRYAYYELFDAGNVDAMGGVLDPNDPRAHYGKVSIVVTSGSTYQCSKW